MTVVRDVSEYVRQPVPIPPFYIQDLLAQRGSMLLAGSPGIKKSFLAQHIGYCIASGIPWLGFSTTQARTIIANFEISSPMFHDRLVGMSSAIELQEQMLYEISPDICYLEDEEMFQQFAADIRPIAPKVIILDCLAGCFGGEENNSREMSTFIRRLAELKREHDAAIILVHHTNKNPLAITPMDKVRGHTKLIGWVDTILYMAKQPTGIQIQFGKTRHSRRELFNMNISFQQYNWIVRGGNNATGTLPIQTNTL